ncbi:hypothetical protein HYV81_04470 [Candidatus Woesearchaeota archaeon]|nr:hypothetical protein [Candidatus Woesearchaeota archaeon]
MEEEIQVWLRKLEEQKKGSADLSRDEDLSIGIMNLLSLEEHLYFTAMKTGNRKYLEMLDSVRELRKKMLAKIVKSPKGEEWCISKHLLAASMRLMEVGTKELSRKNIEEAEEFFTAAFNMYSLFFAINLKLVAVEEFSQSARKPDALQKEDAEKGMMRRFSLMVKKLVDCCKE